jgi:hypothetical protein
MTPSRGIVQSCPPVTLIQPACPELLFQQGIRRSTDPRIFAARSQSTGLMREAIAFQPTTLDTPRLSSRL